MDDDATVPGNDESAANEDETLLERMRDVPVGTLDPNIIGDAGPTDVPPGTDPRAPDEEAPPPGA